MLSFGSAALMTEHMIIDSVDPYSGLVKILETIDEKEQTVH